MKISRELCLRCKGRLYCGLPYCPLLQRFESVKKLNENFEGSGFDVFVGRFNYPNVNIGVVSAPETSANESEIFNNHRNWINNKMKINEIASMRSNTVYSYNKLTKKKIEKEEINYVALSKKPLYLDVELKHKVDVALKSLKDLKPFGARAVFKEITLEDSPKIPRLVEKYMNDEAKAEEVVVNLDKHFDEDYVRKVFSSGKTGLSFNEKIVPTRWSITAIDDIRGNHHMSTVKESDKNESIDIYFSSLYGNYFLVIALPQVFSYELFEFDVNDRKQRKGITSYTHDSETFFGRKEYAHNTAGGYYASRLGVLEGLSREHKQAGILVLRAITDEYTMPLGVWVVREAVRKTMQRKIKSFYDIKEAKEFVYQFILRTFNADISEILKKSKILQYFEKQRDLTEFLRE